MAKIYRFRLEPILRHRRRLEDTAAMDLAAARQRAERIAARLVAIHDEAVEGRLALLEAAGRGSPGVQLRRLAGNVECLRSEAAAVAALLTTERSREEQARARLVQAAQNRRALELLAESQRAAHQREERIQERRAADDLASSAHQWRRLQTTDEPVGR
jgi:flagellar export protein FliJ